MYRGCNELRFYSIQTQKAYESPALAGRPQKTSVNVYTALRSYDELRTDRQSPKKLGLTVVTSRNSPKAGSMPQGPRSSGYHKLKAQKGSQPGYDWLHANASPAFHHQRPSSPVATLLTLALALAFAGAFGTLSSRKLHRTPPLSRSYDQFRIIVIIIVLIIGREVDASIDLGFL